MAIAEDIIRVKIEVDDQSAGLSKVENRMAGLQALGSAVGAGIGASLTAGFAMAAGAAGVGMLAVGIAGLHSELQGAEFGLASLVSALTGQDITTSLKSAREQVRGLKEDAAKGVGELRDYTRGFQQILAPTMNAGATMGQIRELNKLALAAGFALDGQLGLQSVSRDVAQAMDQGVGQMTTPIVNKLLPAIGLTNAEFNKLGKKDRFDALTRAFGTMAEGAALMGTGWEAQVATFQDGVKSIIMDVTKPIFDIWVGQLASANDWMEKNRDAMKEMAEVWGPRLASVWEKVSGDPGMVATGGAGVMGMAGAAGFARAGGVSAIGAATGAGTVASGGILAGVMSILAIGFLALKGAIGEFPKLLELGAFAAARFGVAMGMLWDSLSGLTGSGSILNRVGAGLFLVGVGFVEVLTRITMAIAGFVKFLGTAALWMGQIFDSITSMDFKTASAIATGGGQKAALTTLGKDLAAALTGDIKLPKVRKNSTGEGDSEGGKGLTKPGQGDVHIGKVEVKVKAEVNADPNRVAVSMEEVFSRINQYRKQASVAPLSPKPV